MKDSINKLYDWMFDTYGPQGWWPILSDIETGVGYHKGDYSFPKTDNQKLEICLGAILTQNTAWTNVEMALKNLFNSEIKIDVTKSSSSLLGDSNTNSVNSLSIKKLDLICDDDLKLLIKPAGYFNQKTKYIRNFSAFYKQLEGKTPSRDELLTCKGIGNETADSILLYAYGQPQFVIDTYTKRILHYFGLCKIDEKYMTLKKIFEDSLPKDVHLYQEYHALLVELAKQHFSKKPYGIPSKTKL